MALLAAGLMLVHRTTIAQVVTTLAGSGATGSVDENGAEASFSYPQELAVGPSGNVYVADTNSLKIRKITPEGLAESRRVGNTRLPTSWNRKFDYPHAFNNQGECVSSVPK